MQQLNSLLHYDQSACSIFSLLQRLTKLVEMQQLNSLLHIDQGACSSQVACSRYSLLHRLHKLIWMQQSNILLHYNQTACSLQHTTNCFSTQLGNKDSWFILNNIIYQNSNFWGGWVFNILKIPNFFGRLPFYALINHYHY